MVRYRKQPLSSFKLNGGNRANIQQDYVESDRFDSRSVRNPFIFMGVLSYLPQVQKWSLAKIAPGMQLWQFNAGLSWGVMSERSKRSVTFKKKLTACTTLTVISLSLKWVPGNVMKHAMDSQADCLLFLSVAAFQDSTVMMQPGRQRQILLPALTIYVQPLSTSAGRRFAIKKVMDGSQVKQWIWRSFKVVLLPSWWCNNPTETELASWINVLWIFP